MSDEAVTDGWLQIDLGGYYNVAQVDFCESTYKADDIYSDKIEDIYHNDIGIFLSANDLSDKTYAELEADDTAELIGITHINNGDYVGGGG